MGLHLDIRPIARRHAHVSAGIFDIDSRVGGNLRIKRLLIVIVLGQSKDVEEIVVIVAPLVKPGARVAPSSGGKAEKSQQDDDADETAAAAHRGLPAQIHCPLAQQAEAGADEQKRPPTRIPGPELAGGDVAGEQEQGHHADANEDDRANNRRDPRAVGAHVTHLIGVTLGLPGIALGAPGSPLLLTVDPPLGLRIVGWKRGRRSAARGRVRRYGAHDCPPSGSLSKSCEAGTMAVAWPG